MEYKYVTDAAKAGLLEQRLAQLEQEHYATYMVLIEAQGVGAVRDAEEARAGLKQLEKRIQLLADEAKEYEVEVPTTEE